MVKSHKNHIWTEERSAQFVKRAKNFIDSRYKPFAKDIVSFIKSCNIKKNPKILDIGCGPGLLLIEIKKIAPDVSLIGLDPSKYMLEIAEENAHEFQIADFELKKGYAEQIPIVNNEIDVVVCLNCLHDFNDAEKAMQESYRVLQTNGILVLNDKNGSYPKWRVILGFIPYIFKMGFKRARMYLKSGKLWLDPNEVYDWLLNLGYDIKVFKKKLDFLIVAKKNNSLK
jgi:ubiquinone/menaquinone biosynthesis C-methylase UbiE